MIRGLIRLWIFLSCIWIVVFPIAVSLPQTIMTSFGGFPPEPPWHGTTEEHTIHRQDGLVIADDVLSKDLDTHADWEKSVEPIRQAQRSLVPAFGLLFGMPILIFILGAGTRWVILGFKGT
jgi:hypothetical protein